MSVKYKRVIIKISGEALAKDNGMGIDNDKLSFVVDQILAVKELGAEIGIVVGAGNFWRGRQADPGMNRTTADHMGMIATVINALAIQDRIERKGVAPEGHQAVAGQLCRCTPEHDECHCGKQPHPQGLHCRPRTANDWLVRL